MKSISRIFVIPLLLMSTAAIAAPKAKDLVCHVGNEYGPEGQVYDPNCEPSVDYDCSADAGKVDLLVVPPRSKHIGNPSHAWEGLEDYDPIAMGASGEGTEDSDGNGVDDGCELPIECPCWATSDLQAVTSENFNSWDGRTCDPGQYPAFVLLAGGELGEEFGFAAISDSSFSKFICDVFDYPDYEEVSDVSEVEADACVAQLAKRCADLGHSVITLD